jgi:hypothetical protein
MTAHVASRNVRQPSADSGAGVAGFRDGGGRQIRSLVFQAKKTKAATSVIMISIQFWPSKPRKVKCSMRNCTAPAPNFGQNKHFICAG